MHPLTVGTSRNSHSCIESAHSSWEGRHPKVQNPYTCERTQTTHYQRPKVTDEWMDDMEQDGRDICIPGCCCACKAANQVPGSHTELRDDEQSRRTMLVDVVEMSKQCDSVDCLRVLVVEVGRRLLSAQNKPSADEGGCPLPVASARFG